MKVLVSGISILTLNDAGSCQMLTFDDKGGWGGQKTQKPAYVIHGCSLSKWFIPAFKTNELKYVKLKIFLFLNEIRGNYRLAKKLYTLKLKAQTKYKCENHYLELICWFFYSWQPLCIKVYSRLEFQEFQVEYQIC